MRHVSRRSFTVEVKSAGRRNATFIPSRVAEPAAPQPRPAFPSAPAAPAPEKRRILPNLIEPDVPDVAPEPAPAAEDAVPRRPRGRPRKPRPDPVEAEAAFPAVPSADAPDPWAPRIAPPPQPAPETAPPRPTAARTGQTLDLARGERWKRRLGRWSR